MENNELQIFDYENNKIRTVMRGEEVWWVLKDVCEVLGINNSKMVASRLENDEKAGVSLSDLSSNGVSQKRNFCIVNEAGLYKTIFRSDKPEAKKFMHWVTHEVLPSIRKHGAYITPQKVEELMQNPDTWIKLIQTLQEERKAKAKLQDKIKPATRCCIHCLPSRRELSKVFNALNSKRSEIMLVQLYRQDGFLIKRNSLDYNMPTQRSMEMGLFKIKETSISHSDGHISISKTTKITDKGQRYFINLFLGEKGAKNAGN